METLNIFSEVLGLPSTGCAGAGGQLPVQGSPSKMKKAPPSSLSYRDIVVLCKDPERKRLYPKVGNVYKLDTPLFGEFVTAVDRSVYVTTLRDHGCPVRVVTSTSSGELALPERDEITVSWVNPASGLEWAVVVFVPGDPPVGQQGGATNQAEKAAEESDVAMEEESHRKSIAPASPGAALPFPGPDEVEAGLEAVRMRMSEPDRDYLFWGASRCTAQLVTLIP